MPTVIRKAVQWYKDENGVYHSFDMASDQATAERIQAIDEHVRETMESVLPGYNRVVETVQGLSETIIDKMTYVQLEAINSNGIWRIYNGLTMMSFDRILEICERYDTLVYLIMADRVYIPSISLNREVIEFTSASMMGSDPAIHQLIVRQDSSVELNTYYLETEDHKINDISNYHIGEDEDLYPTADAVAREIQRHDEEINAANEDIANKADEPSVTYTSSPSVMLQNNETTIITETLSSLSVAIDTPEIGKEFICGINFKAGQGFMFSDIAPEGYVIRWGEEPTWKTNAVYELIYRYIGIDNIISVNWSELL